MKKIFLLITLLFISVNLFSNPEAKKINEPDDAKKSVLEGAWCSDWVCEAVYKSNGKYDVVKLYGEKVHKWDWLIIRYPEKNSRGYITCSSEPQTGYIIQKIEVNDDKVKFSCIPGNADEDEEDLCVITVRLIDDYEIAVEGFGYTESVRLYHFSNSKQNAGKKAVLNDSRVRLRTKPDLKCQTWKLLDKGAACVIKEASKEKETIDGESFYWYKIDVENEPDGWVYGKYLDFQ